MIFHNEINILDYIGYFGPFILFTVTIIYFWYAYKNQRHKVKSILFRFMKLFALSIVVNIIIKNIIVQPRPPNEIQLFKRIWGTIDKHGMPSGHVQHALFITTFFILNALDTQLTSTQFALMSLGYIALSILTILQRYTFNSHYLGQILVGGIIGVAIGTL